jgi:hypothetical protein
LSCVSNALPSAFSMGVGIVNKRLIQQFTLDCYPITKPNRATYKLTKIEEEN